MSERDEYHQANFILRHEDVYRRSPMFRIMVNRTVYLTQADKEKSILAVDGVYGANLTREWRDPDGA
jgi:hypothetical protein